MAVTDAYATSTQYHAQITKQDTGSDAQIDLDLLAVSRYIDRCIGRFFTKDAAPVARVYTPPGSLRQPLATPPLGWAESENPYRYGVWGRHLAVDDIATATGLQIIMDDNRVGSFSGYTPWATTDYELWPLNAPFGSEARPYTSIVLPPWSTIGGIPIGVRVQVTAVYGWPAVPQAIINATVQLTAILRLESPRATSRVTEVGEVIGVSKRAQDIIYDLKTIYGKESSFI